MFTGEMTERPKVHDWKSCVPVRVPRVQIPISPDFNINLIYQEDYMSEHVLHKKDGKKAPQKSLKEKRQEKKDKKKTTGANS